MANKIKIVDPEDSKKIEIYIDDEKLKTKHVQGYEIIRNANDRGGIIFKVIYHCNISDIKINKRKKAD